MSHSRKIIRPAVDRKSNGVAAAVVGAIQDSGNIRGAHLGEGDPLRASWHEAIIPHVHEVRLPVGVLLPSKEQKMHVPHTLSTAPMPVQELSKLVLAFWEEA
jgi:hypothetical protein